MARNVTLLDLVTAVNDSAETEAEVIATVVHMVNSGAVRLCDPGIARDRRRGQVKEMDPAQGRRDG